MNLKRGHEKCKKLPLGVFYILGFLILNTHHELPQHHQHLNLPPQAPGHHHQDIKDLHRHPLFWNQIHTT